MCIYSNLQSSIKELHVSTEKAFVGTNLRQVVDTLGKGWTMIGLASVRDRGIDGATVFCMYAMCCAGHMSAAGWYKLWLCSTKVRERVSKQAHCPGCTWKCGTHTSGVGTAVLKNWCRQTVCKQEAHVDTHLTETMENSRCRQKYVSINPIMHDNGYHDESGTVSNFIRIHVCTSMCIVQFPRIYGWQHRKRG